MTFRLSETVVEFLRTREDMTATVENAICETPEFFAWDFEQDEKRKRKSNL